jgi:hypothetical protein
MVNNTHLVHLGDILVLWHVQDSCEFYHDSSGNTNIRKTLENSLILMWPHAQCGINISEIAGKTPRKLLR